MVWILRNLDPVRAQGTWTVSFTYASEWGGQNVFLSELSFQSLTTCVVPCGIGSEKIQGLGPGLSPLPTEITFNIFVDQSDLANCCLDGNLRFDLQMDNGLRFPEVVGGDFDLVLTKGGTTLVPDLSEPLSFFLYGINGGQNNAVVWILRNLDPVRAQGTWTVSFTYASEWGGQNVFLSELSFSLLRLA